jgi:hypothetical protein
MTKASSNVGGEVSCMLICFTQTLGKGCEILAISAVGFNSLYGQASLNSKTESHFYDMY